MQSMSAERHMDHSPLSVQGVRCRPSPGIEVHTTERNVAGPCPLAVLDMTVTNCATSLCATGLKKVLLCMADLSMPGAPLECAR